MLLGFENSLFLELFDFFFLVFYRYINTNILHLSFRMGVLAGQFCIAVVAEMGLEKRLELTFPMMKNGELYL